MTEALTFFSELREYTNNGCFSYQCNESLKEKCNAPDDKGGVYLIFGVVNNEEILLYIGSSGQFKNGKYQVRKTGLGGIKDRIVNGTHPLFGQKRCNCFPEQMALGNINELKIYWWVIYEDNKGKLPTEVENDLLKKYRSKHECIPKWHKNRKRIR